MKARIISILLVPLLLFAAIPMIATETNAYNVVMTAQEFVDALKIALSRDTVYKNVYPYNLGYYDGSQISWDCWNLGKSIIWTQGEIVNNYTVGYYAKRDSYSGLGDWDGLTIIKTAPNCNSDFTNLVPGEWLYMSGHTGYYIGDGQVIECTAGWGTYKVVQSQISETGVRSRNGVQSGSWLYHGMVPWIDYSAYLEPPLETNDLTFDSDDYKRTLYDSHNSQMSLTYDGLEILATDTLDPYVRLKNITFSADTNKYLSFYAKTSYVGEGTQKVGFFLSAGDLTYATEECKAVAYLPETGEYEKIVIDLSSLSLWTGDVNVIRIDPFDDSSGALVGEGIIVRQMKFFSSLAEAQAYVHVAPAPPYESNAFYTVNASSLNIRSADNTSSTILGAAPNGSEMAVLDFNSDYTWAQIRYGSISGWCSMDYLVFKESFGTMNVVYDLNGVEANAVAGGTYSPFDTVMVGGADISAENYEFLGWTLTRASDGKALGSGGAWVTAGSEDSKVFYPGDAVTLGYENLSRASSDDTYTFTANWQEIKQAVISGDANGDGTVTAKDLAVFKRHLAGVQYISDDMLSAVDINADGMVTSNDLSLLMRLLVS